MGRIREVLKQTKLEELLRRAVGDRYEVTLSVPIREVGPHFLDDLNIGIRLDAVAVFDTTILSMLQGLLMTKGVAYPVIVDKKGRRINYYKLIDWLRNISDKLVVDVVKVDVDCEENPTACVELFLRTDGTYFAMCGGLRPRIREIHSDPHVAYVLAWILHMSHRVKEEELLRLLHTFRPCLQDALRILYLARSEEVINRIGKIVSRIDPTAIDTIIRRLEEEKRKKEEADKALAKSTTPQVQAQPPPSPRSVEETVEEATASITEEEIAVPQGRVEVGSMSEEEDVVGKAESGAEDMEVFVEKLRMDAYEKVTRDAQSSLVLVESLINAALEKDVDTALKMLKTAKTILEKLNITGKVDEDLIREKQHTLLVSVRDLVLRKLEKQHRWLMENFGDHVNRIARLFLHYIERCHRLDIEEAYNSLLSFLSAFAKESKRDEVRQMLAAVEDFLDAVNRSETCVDMSAVYMFLRHATEVDEDKVITMLNKVAREKLRLSPRTLHVLMFRLLNAVYALVDQADSKHVLEALTRTEPDEALRTILRMLNSKIVVE